MKLFVLLAVVSVAVAACGPGSSPEGRMTMKLTELKQELDSLKTQNAQIKDSLAKVSADLRELKK